MEELWRSVGQCTSGLGLIYTDLNAYGGAWEPETPKIHPKMNILGAFWAEIAKLLDFRSNPGLTSRVSELEIGSNNCPSGAFRSDPLETWSDNTKTRVLLELFPKFQGQASEYFDWLYSIPLPTIILKQPCYL